MKVAILAAGADTGGQGIRIKRAFDRHAPGWEVRAMRASRNYLEFPTDLEYSASGALELYAWADVVHIHNSLAAYERLDHGRGTPTILHHHGTRFRTDPGPLAAAARRYGVVQVVATLDLAFEPDLTWLPAPHDLDAYAEIRGRTYRPDGRISIAHAPTDRGIKSTRTFLEAVDRLARRYPVEAVVIERQAWSRCIAVKATADILYDQVILGYGNNAIEGWGLGMPVVAGVVDPIVRARMLERFGELPFYEASEDTLEAALEALVADADLRRTYAERGLAHARRFHDEAVVVEQLVGIYANAPATSGGSPPARQDRIRLSRMQERRMRRELARAEARRAVA